MKQFIYILFSLSIMFLVSCEKLDTTAPETNDLLTVSFKTQVVTGYIPTKAFSDEVLDNLPFEYPTELMLYNWQTKQSYKVDLTTENTVSLQKGEYYVQATVGKYDDCHVTSQKTIPLYAGTGSVTINGVKKTFCGTINITDEKTYTIDLHIGGLIVACEKNTVSYFKYEDFAGTCPVGVNLKNDNCFETNNYYYYILALSSELLEKGGAVYKYVGVEMGETEKNEKTYKKLYVTAGGEKSVLGKYYLFTTNEKDYREFDFSTSSWTSGGTI